MTGLFSIFSPLLHPLGLICLLLATTCIVYHRMAFWFLCFVRHWSAFLIFIHGQKLFVSCFRRPATFTKQSYSWLNISNCSLYAHVEHCSNSSVCSHVILYVVRVFLDRQLKQIRLTFVKASPLFCCWSSIVSVVVGKRILHLKYTDKT